MVNEPETPRGDGDDKKVTNFLDCGTHAAFSPTVAAILAAQPLNPLTKAIVTWAVEGEATKEAKP